MKWPFVRRKEATSGRPRREQLGDRQRAVARAGQQVDPFGRRGIAAWPRPTTVDPQIYLTPLTAVHQNGTLDPRSMISVSF
jgi:hypothetical protein